MIKLLLPATFFSRWRGDASNQSTTVHSQAAYFFSVLFLLLAGCSQTRVIKNSGAPDSARPEYSLVFYIHGDGDYLYHTNRGKRVYADDNALDKARSVAENAAGGEVIIFHRQPERAFLGLFPRRSSRMYVYRSGVMQSRIKYRKESSGGSFMKEERTLFREFVDTDRAADLQTHFFYFGHEIPQQPVSGYHESSPGRRWGTPLFAEEIAAFLPPGRDHFGLVGLSTCSNGTPEMAHQLKPISRTLLASPQNLHLSHMDIEALSELGNSPDPDHEPEAITRRLAEETYSRLSKEVHTEVTLSVYDLESDQLSLDGLLEAAETYRQKRDVNYSRDNVDCAEVLPVDMSRYAGGVTTFYKPPRFGGRADVDSHSGWGCKPEL